MQYGVEQYQQLRLEAMDKAIKQLRIDNKLYAMMLFQVNMLPEDDDHYEMFVEMEAAEYKRDQDTRDEFYKDLTEGDPEE